MALDFFFFQRTLCVFHDHCWAVLVFENLFLRQTPVQLRGHWQMKKTFFFSSVGSLAWFLAPCGSSVCVVLFVLCNNIALFDVWDEETETVGISRLHAQFWKQSCSQIKANIYNTLLSHMCNASQLMIFFHIFSYRSNDLHRYYISEFTFSVFQNSKQTWKMETRFSVYPFLN